MMIRESLRTVKKGRARILITVGSAWARTILALGEAIISRAEARALKGEMGSRGSDLDSLGSPLDHVGPVPEELRRNPFPGGSVPWSILEAEREKVRAREMLILEVAVGMSWVVTVVTVLRALGLL